MTEAEMAEKLRAEVADLVRVSDGVYIFNSGEKYGTIKNYMTDSEHYEVLFDNMTREQVIEIFKK